MSDMENLQQLLAAQAQGQGGVAEVLAGHHDPTVRLLAQLWARQAENENEEDDEDEGEFLISESPTSEESNSLERMQRRCALLHEELEHHQAVSDTLASALGACPECWGEEVDCEFCGGEGTPGWELPDRRLFRRLVLPALERLRRTTPTTAGRPRHLHEVRQISDRVNDSERRPE